MNASFYKPTPENNRPETWKQYARQLEMENADLRKDLDYEINRSQALIAISQEAINQDILRELDETGSWIMAIKRARYLMSLGLKEAKEHYETLIGIR